MAKIFRIFDGPREPWIEEQTHEKVMSRFELIQLFQAIIGVHHLLKIDDYMSW